MERDSGPGSGILYSIVSGADERFSINPSTGVITNTVPLDREEFNRYIITVKATDTGDVSLAGFAQVYPCVCT